MIEEKFVVEMRDLQKQKATPQTVRGMEVSSLSTENIRKNEVEKLLEHIRVRNITFGGLAVYMLLFTFLPWMLSPLSDTISSWGLGIQGIILTLIMLGINVLLDYFALKSPWLQNRALTQMLQVYALICMLITIVLLNQLPEDLFSLAP